NAGVILNPKAESARRPRRPGNADEAPEPTRGANPGTLRLICNRELPFRPAPPTHMNCHDECQKAEAKNTDADRPIAPEARRLDLDDTAFERELLSRDRPKAKRLNLGLVQGFATALIFFQLRDLARHGNAMDGLGVFDRLANADHLAELVLVLHLVSV